MPKTHKVFNVTRIDSKGQSGFLIPLQETPGRVAKDKRPPTTIRRRS